MVERKWYNDLSIAVIVIMLVMVIFFFAQAIIHDRKILIIRKLDRDKRRADNLARYKEALLKLQNDTSGKYTSIRDYYAIPQKQRAEIREVVMEILEDKEKNKLWTSRIISASQSGFVFGVLSGAIMGGYNAAISGGFIWTIIRAVVEGINMQT